MSEDRLLSFAEIITCIFATERWRENIFGMVNNDENENSHTFTIWMPWSIVNIKNQKIQAGNKHDLSIQKGSAVKPVTEGPVTLENIIAADALALCITNASWVKVLMVFLWD